MSNYHLQEREAMRIGYEMRRKLRQEFPDTVWVQDCIIVEVPEGDRDVVLEKVRKFWEEIC